MRKLLLTCLAIATVMVACDKKTPTGPEGIDPPNRAAQSTTTTSIFGQTTAAFVFSPVTPRLSQPVAFSAVTSAAAAGHTIVSYSWDLGDGDTAVGLTVGHAYAVEGTYNVTLKVTDDVGNTATTSRAVPVGGSLTTTTTTVSPIGLLVRYVSTQVPNNVPSDMTLNFRLLGSGGQSSSFPGRQADLQPLADGPADAPYEVRGIFSTVSGVTGTVQGNFTGTITPAVLGEFIGTLTANLPGCSAEREFRGTTSQLLSWTGENTRSNTCGEGNNPLAFPSLTLVRTEAPPPNTPVTTTTTTVLPPGSLSGIVTDATTGQPIPAALVAVTGGGSAVTNASGAYTISNVQTGTRAVQVTAALYVPRVDSVTIVSGTSNAYSPVLTHITGDLKIVLRWGTTPADLDLHLILPDNVTEVNYLHLNPVPYASLDFDDNDGGIGPETITVTPSSGGTFVPGVYSVYVHNFTAFRRDGPGTPGFNASSPPATVEVLQGTTQITQFVASAASGDQVTSPEWSVFSFRLAATPSGHVAITPIQQFISRNFDEPEGPESPSLRAKPLKR